METGNPTPKLTRKQKIAAGIPKEIKGNRKANSAIAIKEAESKLVKAVLWGFPSSPQKMRLVADLVRGKEVGKAMAILKLAQRHAATPLLKLLNSAINNWEQKFPDTFNPEELYIRTLFVDSAAMVKRVRPAPQGRAYRVRKRSNHVTLILGHLSEKTKVEA